MESHAVAAFSDVSWHVKVTVCLQVQFLTADLFVGVRVGVVG